VELFALPHAEAARRLRDGAIVWLPVNPVEYHGPHLPLHTDRLLSAALARDLCARLGEGEALLAGDLEVGVDPTPGPGTCPVSYRDVTRRVLEACRGLVALGARRVVLVTFHGAPLHNLALHVAARWLRRAGVQAASPFQEVVRAQLALDVEAFRETVVHLPPAVADEVLRGLALDFHAGFFETSLALHWAPGAVQPLHRALPPCPPIPPDGVLRSLAALAGRLGRPTLAAELGFASVGAAWPRLRPFPGYTGHPAHATPEAGRLFARAVVDRLAPSVRDALSGRDDRPPPLAWLGPVTLWGRLGPRPPSLADIAPAPATS
jgi:creatinine amidohydrolase